MHTGIIATAAFLLGVATPVAAWRFSTDRPDYDGKDVEVMHDGSLAKGDGVWSGKRVRGADRVLFYLQHPTAPRPRGNGDLWVLEQQQRWTKPIVVLCSMNGGPCKTKMPPNELGTK